MQPGEKVLRMSRNNRNLLCCALMVFFTGPACAEDEDIRVLLAPQREAKLAAQLSERVTAVHVAVGERFVVGQVLMEFDCAVRRADLARELAELKAAQAALAANRKLRELGSGSQLDLQTALAHTQKAEAAVGKARVLVRQCRIKAPFTGRVHDILINAHESVRVGDPLLDILDDSELQVELFVPSHWLRWLQTGLAFQVMINETGQSYPASISHIGARVDPVSRSIAITGLLQEKPPELLAGMSGQARFVVPGMAVDE